jgi:hydroxymethylbilane synthase
MHITEYLAESVMLPAVGQGALCIEIREGDTPTAALVEMLDHPPTRHAVAAERAFLSRLEGSCQVPIAAAATIAGDRVFLRGLVADLSGQRVLQGNRSGGITTAQEVGSGLAQQLLDAGAREIIEDLFARMKMENER